MDSITRLEEIQKKNEQLFEAIRYRRPDLNKVFSEDGFRGFYINNGKSINHIMSYVKESGLFIERDDVWLHGALQWLYNSEFIAYAMSIDSLDPLGISISGVWKAGDFLGKSFLDSSGAHSHFMGGNFKGVNYKAYNLGFGHDMNGNPIPAMSPLNFMGKTFWDSQNGILGKGNLQLNQKYKTIEIVTIPVGGIFIVNSNYGQKEQVFKLVKRLDQTNSSFVFNNLKSREIIEIDWETIRSNYSVNGFIQVGQPFVLKGRGGVINLPEINNIELVSDYDMAEFHRVFTVDGTRNTRLQRLGINFAYNINARSIRSAQEIEKLLEDIKSGEFFDKLAEVKKAIEDGEIKGYAPYKDLAPLFNNVQGYRVASGYVKHLLEYLSRVKKYIIDMAAPNIIKEVAQKASEVILGHFKKYLGIDKHIKPIEKGERPVEYPEEQDPRKEPKNFIQKLQKTVGIRPTPSKETVGNVDVSYIGKKRSFKRK